MPVSLGGTGSNRGAAIGVNIDGTLSSTGWFNDISTNPSTIGSARITDDNVWRSYISVRHRNGSNAAPGGDSANYGFMLVDEAMTAQSSANITIRKQAGGTWLSPVKLYSTGNTTKASDGTLKAASPVVKLFADGSFETNGESEGCTVTRMKAGEYLIEGCMGMNSDAAWGGIDGGFDIPKDRNGQALIWLDYEVNADGSVLVKTFHREYPSAPIFARNSREGFVDGEPADIPADQFVSVRVEMPQNSIWNQRAAMAEVSDSSSD